MTKIQHKNINEIDINAITSLEIPPFLKAYGIVLGAKLAVILIDATKKFFLSSSTNESKKLEDEIFKITGKKITIKIFSDYIPQIINFGSGIIPTFRISSGLIDLCSERELIAVVLHTVSIHYLRKPLIDFTAILSWTVLLKLISAMVGADEKIPDYKTASISEWSWWLINQMTFFYIIYSVPMMIRRSPYSKYFKNTSDKFVIEKGYGNELKSALEKLEIFFRKREIPCSNIICKAYRKLLDLKAIEAQLPEDDQPEYLERVKDVGQLIANKQVQNLLKKGDTKKVENIFRDKFLK